jgi:hypothetical protein
MVIIHEIPVTWDLLRSGLNKRRSYLFSNFPNNLLRHLSSTDNRHSLFNYASFLISDLI